MNIENFNGTSDRGKVVPMEMVRTTASEGSRHLANLSPIDNIQYETFEDEHFALKLMLIRLKEEMEHYTEDAIALANHRLRITNPESTKDDWYRLKNKMLAERKRLASRQRQIEARLIEIRPRLKAEKADEIRRRQASAVVAKMTRAAAQAKQLEEDPPSPRASEKPPSEGLLIQREQLLLLREIRDLLLELVNSARKEGE